MENFTPVSAFLGGSLIGLSAILLLLYNGRTAGISGIMNGVFLSPGHEQRWRLAFLLGLILGAFIFQQIVPDFIQFRSDYPLALVAIGGFLVGVGTRLSSGCTSGHGICGIANLSRRSIIATLCFMASGFITVFITKHVLYLI